MSEAGTTNQKKIIHLFNELLDMLESNRASLHIVGHIMPDVAIRWRCCFPIFPRGHPIYTEYVRIGDPKELKTLAKMNVWVSEAMALTETTISILQKSNDDQLKSAGISLLPGAKPPLEVREHLLKYKLISKETYLLNEIAEECERASLLDCRRACAFYVRKMLEVSIRKKAQIEGVPLKNEDHMVGLRPLLGHYKETLGDLHDELLSRKFLLEETIHADHNPSFVELRNAVDLIFRAIDKLDVFDIETGGG